MNSAISQFDQFDMPVKNRADVAELCRGNDATGPILCAKASNSITLKLTSSQVARLCAGASSLAPVNCMKEAEKFYGMADNPIGTQENALRLCARAKNNSSLDCAKELGKLVQADLIGATYRSNGEVATICSAENN